MSPIYLTPSGLPISGMVSDLRNRLKCLSINVIDEDLAVTTPHTVYQSSSKEWMSFPVPRIRKIDINGFEIPMVVTVDYSLNLTEGRVTLTSAAGADETVRADYTYELFDDSELLELLEQSAREVKNLLHRNLETDDVNESYREAILKRAYTNAFRCLIEPTFNYFSVNVGGRAIDKTNLTAAITAIIKTNEEMFIQEINSLRNFNQTNRLN